MAHGKKSKLKTPSKPKQASAHKLGGTPNDGTARRVAGIRRAGDAARHVAENLKGRHDAAIAQFVSTEVDLALTFCEMASSSANSEDSERRIQRAYEAYRSARHYLGKMDASDGVKKQIREQVLRLKKSLDKVT